MAEPSIGGHSRPTIVIVGAASRDLDAADARGWRLGGGVTYGSLAAARLGATVHALMGVDADAASAHELEILRAAGVELQLVPLVHGPVFDNVERADGRVQVAFSASDRLPLSDLPADWRTPDAAILDPIAGELGDEWAAAFVPPTLVALGWQGLFRRLVPGQVVDPVPLAAGRLVERADLALVSADDARAGGAPLLSLLRPGQQLVVSHGVRGALHLDLDRGGLRVRHLPALPITRAGDPTGAGDVLLATWAVGLAGLRARGLDADSWRVLALAVAAAAAKVEARTLAEMPDLRALCDRLIRPPGVAQPPG